MSEAAEDSYREAIDRLSRTRLRPELARAHLFLAGRRSLLGPVAGRRTLLPDALVWSWPLGPISEVICCRLAGSRTVLVAHLALLIVP